MRQIQYRGKRLDNGKWAYGDLVHGAERTFGDTEVKIHTPPTDSKHHGIYDVDPETVGQLLPVLSIDEASVYEGDIVDYPGSTALRSVVVWNDEEGAFQLDLAHQEYGQAWAKGRMVQLMQVVGDIHTGSGKL